MTEKIYKELKKVVENIYVYEDQMIEIACHIDRHYTKKTEHPKRKPVNGVLPLTEEELTEFGDVVGDAGVYEVTIGESDVIYYRYKIGVTKYNGNCVKVKAILWLANLFDLEG